jgi:conjugation system TraG family ATPase
MNNTKGILVTDRFGSPKTLDLFHKPIENQTIFNRNGVIIGPSGSGKSFTTNLILYYTYLQGAHITIVDIGHSYKRLGEVLNAKYISHDDDKPIQLNPFFYKEESQVTTEFKNVIVQVLYILFKNQNENFVKSEEVALTSMVEAYYRFLFKHKNIKANFNSFFEFAKEEYPNILIEEGGRETHEFDLTKFLYNIRLFYGDRQFGYLLNSPVEEDLSQLPLVIYDIDNLRDNAILLPIVTLIITNTYVSQLFNVKDKLKILIIEEAWKAVSNEFFADFLLWSFKTARKHGGSIFVVTQDIEDLKKSKAIGDAIINSTDIKILMDMRQYKQDVEAILNLFNINVDDLSQIFSINKRPFDRPRFNEMAVLLKDQCKVYGIEVSREAYALFTTTAKEVEQIKTIARNKGISQKDAAIEWAQYN